MIICKWTFSKSFLKRFHNSCGLETFYEKILRWCTVDYKVLATGIFFYAFLVGKVFCFYTLCIKFWSIAWLYLLLWRVRCFWFWTLLQTSVEILLNTFVKVFWFCLLLSPPSLLILLDSRLCKDLSELSVLIWLLCIVNVKLDQSLEDYRLSEVLSFW